jgi:hypothetical protein
MISTLRPLLLLRHGGPGAPKVTDASTPFRRLCPNALGNLLRFGSHSATTTSALVAGSRMRDGSIGPNSETPCRIALKKMGDSGAEVARFFGVTTSSVNRPAVSPEPPDPSKFPNALQNPRLRGMVHI